MKYHVYPWFKKKLERLEYLEYFNDLVSKILRATNVYYIMFLSEKHKTSMF